MSNDKINEIRVAKKLCEKEHYIDGWNVNMPATSKYAGYRFYSPSRFCDVNEIYVAITKGKNGLGVFTLYKINRLPGERISQTKLKLSFAELKAELAEHSAQFYSE